MQKNVFEDAIEQEEPQKTTGSTALKTLEKVAASLPLVAQGKDIETYMNTVRQNLAELYVRP